MEGKDWVMRFMYGDMQCGRGMVQAELRERHPIMSAFGQRTCWLLRWHDVDRAERTSSSMSCVV